MSDLIESRIDGMAYDEQIAERLRALLDGEPSVEEKKMFGGLAFLINGHMAVAASGQGGILVRVDPDESQALVDETPAIYMEMRGREMPGWLRVDSSEVSSPGVLETWVERGVSFAKRLPPKR